VIRATGEGVMVVQIHVIVGIVDFLVSVLR
jgi:hypothetical protein